MREIKLYGARAAGRVALVDDADYDLVVSHRWFAHEVKVAGRRDHGPYAYANAYRNGHRTRIYMHALIAGFPGADHENHDTLDNRRANLRQANGSQNQGNRRRRIVSTSRHKGVHWDKRRSKWRAEINVGAQYRYLWPLPGRGRRRASLRCRR